jgi:hypothetical protein
MLKEAVNKKNWLFSLAILLVVAVFLSATVSAQAPTKPGSSLEQRVAQRKAERKIKLDEKSVKRLERSCVSAQTNLRQLRDEYVSVFDKRKEVYRKVDAKLWVAIGNLKYVNKDTFRLEQQRAQFLKQANAFDASADEFKQALDDISTMNCAADVVGFKAMVETTRLYNTKLRNQANGITNHVVNNIKPVLSNHANELRPRTSQE